MNNHYVNPFYFDAVGQKRDAVTNQPIIEHRFLTGGDGLPLRFLSLTDEPCPVCGRGAQPNRLAVQHQLPGQETVHCIACDHQVTRKPAPGRLPLMNSGR